MTTTSGNAAKGGNHDMSLAYQKATGYAANVGSAEHPTLGSVYGALFYRTEAVIITKNHFSICATRGGRYTILLLPTSHKCSHE